MARSRRMDAYISCMHGEAPVGQDVLTGAVDHDKELKEFMPVPEGRSVAHMFYEAAIHIFFNKGVLTDIGRQVFSGR